jgi:outer membrane immunogenic protein
MKKKYVALLMLISLTSSILFSQGPIAKGQSQLNMGVGLSSWGVPVYVGMDFGVHKDVTLGFEFSYRAYHDRYNDYRYNHNILGFSGNANYHFNSLLKIPTNWDVYAGINIGFYHWNSSSDYPGGYSSGLGVAGQIGFRYYFTSRLGVNLEFGGGNAFSGGKFGISLRL